MAVLLFDRSNESYYVNKTLPDESMRWEHFPHCSHFTGKWIRVMPLLSFFVVLAFMVILSGRCKGFDTRNNEFSRTDVESRILHPEYAIRTLNETSPLLKAETWKQLRQNSRVATPATLSETLTW
ncbi:hypothetical protein H2198_008148 [Neophaeococcomyces mojaviensis]|uniref:Uncharacterized protein n=1 Tax=Neophaeococcomyces mojaviensis TaxID=3383035 RepID=A0ACC2ZY28_9EURO|nr:hypothetical protein H2198_008148 [Knufia sp. JES_112]